MAWGKQDANDHDVTHTVLSSAVEQATKRLVELVGNAAAAEIVAKAYTDAIAEEEGLEL